MMRTGRGDPIEDNEERCAQMYEIYLPVIETAVVVAAEYATACGRASFVQRDVEYGMKFAARTVVGNQIGTFFPEVYEENESDDDELQAAMAGVAASEEPWTRYEGADERLRLVNTLVESWDEWVPETPADRIIKRCVDQASV